MSAHSMHYAIRVSGSLPDGPRLPGWKVSQKQDVASAGRCVAYNVIWQAPHGCANFS